MRNRQDQPDGFIISSQTTHKFANHTSLITDTTMQMMTTCHLKLSHSFTHPHNHQYCLSSISLPQQHSTPTHSLTHNYYPLHIYIGIWSRSQQEHWGFCQTHIHMLYRVRASRRWSNWARRNIKLLQCLRLTSQHGSLPLYSRYLNIV